MKTVTRKCLKTDCENTFTGVDKGLPKFCPEHNEFNINKCEEEECVREKGHEGFHFSEEDLLSPSSEDKE